MTRKIKKLQGGSLLVGNLPRGCKLCAKGSKMVLFVTGLCDSSCYYCPLSEEKAGIDVIFADEMPVTNEQNIIYETDAIRGEGAGISGGDPLCTLERTLDYIRLLKSKYGKEFHIHLYTSKTT
ncbi:MAG: 4Fe-4S cluster-binding domain-containing protein, partial [Candidatus Thorarchaeota archaeon]